MNRTAKALLIAALVAVVGMAFRVSWNALRDVARAIGADSTAATLYPFVVDGLMALALVATLVLAGNDKRFALRVLAGYAIASLVLNYVHGLVPALHDQAVAWGRLADWSPANYALVLLATSLPVGSIFFGSDLVARVLHYQVPVEPVTEVVVERVAAEPVPVAPVVAEPVVVEPEVTTEVTTEPVGWTSLAELDFTPIEWPPAWLPQTTEATSRATTSAAAEPARQMVTEVVTVTPAELRRQARKLHRQVVAETSRPVTVDRLRSELGLSRREAATLRREILEGAQA